MAYTRIQQPKLADVILEQLESMILEGSLAPGQKLPPERELARQFEVSRPSVREAIQKLEAKGLIVRRQGGGNFVREVLWETLADPMLNLLHEHADSQFDLLEFRYALDGIAAYYAALRGTDADQQVLRDSFAALTASYEADDIDQQARAVVNFSLAITEASHNVVLLHAVRCLQPLLMDSIKNNLTQLASRESLLAQVQVHRQRLLDAILARLPEAARQASQEHLAFIEEALLGINKEQSRIQRSLRRLQQSGREQGKA